MARVIDVIINDLSVPQHPKCKPQSTILSRVVDKDCTIWVGNYDNNYTRGVTITLPSTYKFVGKGLCIAEKAPSCGLAPDVWPHTQSGNKATITASMHAADLKYGLFFQSNSGGPVVMVDPMIRNGGHNLSLPGILMLTAALLTLVVGVVIALPKIRSYLSRSN
jgi:hypothetical protein